MSARRTTLTQKAPEAVIPWTRNYNFQIQGFDAGNLNAQNWRADSNYAVYDIYKDHPDYFVPDLVGNLKRRLDNNKKVGETVRAAYFEVQPRVGKAQFDLGLRYEKHQDRRPDRRHPSGKDVKAAGLSTPADRGRPALPVPQRDLHHPHGEYDDWFLSGGAKYDFTKKLVGQLAFSQSILRPDYGNLGGVVSVDDTNLIVTVPNPLLKPEHSTKYFASLQYFLEPSGDHRPVRLPAGREGHAGDRLRFDDPEDVGYSPGDYPGYTFRSATEPAGRQHQQGRDAGIRPAADLPAGRAQGAWACAARSPRSIPTASA
jgi:iron complex outermembrane receptor protein